MRGAGSGRPAMFRKEAAAQMNALGIGQSTSVGIGGDPINGMSHLDAVKIFNDDPGTEAMILIGEIGGSAEEEAASWIKDNCQKPVAAFIAGVTAPPGKKMGHAGAIISGSKGTAQAKMAVLEDAGVPVILTRASEAPRRAPRLAPRGRGQRRGRQVAGDVRQ